jgi:transcriptional regulator with AAA-type ATPase domain
VRRTFTRKEIAQMLNMSCAMVKNNERKLGLSAARRDLNSRVVLYDAQLVLRSLSARGLIEASILHLPADTIVERVARLERLLGIGWPH